MKKVLLLCSVAIAAIVLAGCQEATVCHIHGTVVGERYEGKRIFLVPFTGPATAETVDSVEIKDGKFEFTPDSLQMYKILLDYHYRLGTQPLLVIGEPGDIQVTIDSISSATGTPQNDSLQVWKELTEKHNRQMMVWSRQKSAIKSQGDTAETARIDKQMHDYHLTYKNRSRQLAASMKQTILGDFLDGLFPLTYKRKMPDGTIVTMNADTNEPVK